MARKVWSTVKNLSHSTKMWPAARRSIFCWQSEFFFGAEIPLLPWLGSHRKSVLEGAFDVEMLMTLLPAAVSFNDKYYIRVIVKRRQLDFMLQVASRFPIFLRPKKNKSIVFAVHKPPLYKPTNFQTVFWENFYSITINWKTWRLVMITPVTITILCIRNDDDVPRLYWNYCGNSVIIIAVVPFSS